MISVTRAQELEPSCGDGHLVGVIETFGDVPVVVEFSNASEPKPKSAPGWGCDSGADDICIFVAMVIEEIGCRR